MLNCNSQQRAEGLQEAFFPPPCSSAADRIQASSYTQQQILVPPAVVVVDAHSFQDSPNSSSQEIQSQDNLHHQQQQQQHKPAGSLINLQGFGGEDHHPMFGGTINVNHAHGGMGGLDLLGGLEPCDQHNVMKFADMDAWNSLQLAGPSSLSLHHHHAATTSYRNLLTSSSLMDQPLSLDYGAHSGSLNHVTCPGSAAMHSPTIYERGGMRMDTATTPRESADSSNSSQSFQSRLMSEPTMNLNLHHSSGGGGGGIPLHIRKGISFDTGLGLNLHHPRFDYSLAPAQLMSLESGPSFMTHSVENQIHLGTPVDQAALCGGGVHMNAYSLGGGGGAGMSRLPADHGLTQISQILPSKAAKTSIVTQFSPPGHNFLFGSSLTAPPVCNALKLPALNFKYNPPKVEPPQSLHFLDSSLKLFDGYTASQQSSVTDGRPLKKEKQSEFNISFRGARHAMQVDDAESPGPRDHFSKNIITGSSAMGSVLSSEHSSHASNSADSISKRPRLNDPQVTAATNLPFKVRKEKLGERITALQQLVSPFGKTDTASVLLEAIGYIKFLQEQVQLLSTPYMKNLCVSSSPHDGKQSWTADKGKAGESELSDLRSKGLCLMPISCTIHVANDNGADYWTPTIGGSSR